MVKRVFLIVLDSFGIGNAPDAAAFGDEGSNTLAAVAHSSKFCVPNMQKLGLFNIDGVNTGVKTPQPSACFARLREISMGKDTTIGHWEMAGVVSHQPLPTFPNGFPASFIKDFEEKTGRKTLCNLPYSGTEVIKDYGEEHLRTGALIVYTSADSVCQIAANEAIVPVAELYRYCEIARNMLTGELGVGRIIARPFTGTAKENFKRSTSRHDYSLTPPQPTMLDAIKAAGLASIGVGKIYDIFAGQGVTETHKSTGNINGMEVTLQLAQTTFNGLAFVNLVDFDMIYGHRNDVEGYAAALTAFDKQLGELLALLREDDLLMITADHGCDPSTPSTDHSRECVPLLLYGSHLKAGINLGTIDGFTCVADTVCRALQVHYDFGAANIYNKIMAE